MRFGVADFGMSVWEGGAFDFEERLVRLKDIGYEGIERIEAASADQALSKAARFRRLGMDFGTCRGPNVGCSIEWTAGLGKSYVWVAVSASDFDVFCRQASLQAEACERWGLRAALHNHLNTPVETQQQLDAFMSRCPRCSLILDTAHLAAAGGDAVGTARRYADRLAALHLKDWLAANPPTVDGRPQGRFCELGAGNIGLDNVAVLHVLQEAGWHGWVFVEQDTHLQDPLRDLAISREYIRQAGW